jgi:2-haloacid dehalogenase
MAKLQDEVTALIFDTWGTVVDWRGSVLDELCALGRRKNLKIDWEAFLDASKQRLPSRAEMGRDRGGQDRSRQKNGA